jgi:uncharacterized membrane protein
VVIPSGFVFLAIAVSVVGVSGYIRDTLRGVTSPNRVTWSLWAVEGVLAFIVEVQQHVGLASLMTLAMGFVPFIVVLATFRTPHRAWKISKFDIVCGAVSVLGLIFWSFINEPTVALIAFVAADHMAALPTMRKSWAVPSSETARTFFLGTVNCAITLMTLKHFTTAGVLFPGCVMVTDFVIATLVVTSIGPKVRGDALLLSQGAP